MSKKRKSYTPEFKTKVVLELLEGEKTVSQLASEYEILPASLKAWKKQFLENASLAFDKSVVVKEYKEKISKLEREHNQLAKKVGTLTIERDWLAGKLCSLDLSTKKRLASKGDVQAAAKEKTPSLNRRLELMRISKTAWYYRHADPFGTTEDALMLNMIDHIYTKHPYYGHRRIRKVLNRIGFPVGRKRVISAMKHMGIVSLYPKPKTTVADKEHLKYPYLLSAYKNDEGQVIVEKPNEVWSTDITYIRLAKGYAYLAAVIDWHSKRILSWKVSTTMDTELTTSVLHEALVHHPRPKIFNTDQGSQYTAKAHIDILVKHGISISMDAKGRSIDNIAIERFWRTLKYEDVYPKGYATLKEARAGIGEYIRTYNEQRLHSVLDYKTPDEVYFGKANTTDFMREKWLADAA
jgi:putative transposase